ncbi:MAG: tetratricopeptide repeat protein [Marinobacter sp.]|uniref:tetratricopeptide repeat protein n=1 Tax=Marinobacter sp. TaxID=50741 RepID=UPI003297BA30
MYRWYFTALIIVFLTGCAGFDGRRLFEVPSDTQPLPRNTAAPPAVSQPETEPYELQRQALFKQPYIDPLTDYLKEYGNDTDRAAVLRIIEHERDRRCKVIARDYAGEPATEQKLARYRAGYNYSCPEDVEAFAERVSRNRKTEPPATIAAPDTKQEDPAPQSQHGQSLSDCYLLTTIRNYSAAREACRESAESGDSRSQANMAIIAHAFEDYVRAFEWAQKAAPVSGKASYLLGQMYHAGRGVEQNTEQAVYWYGKAASQGHKEARMALERYRDQTPADGT